MEVDNQAAQETLWIKKTWLSLPADSFSLTLNGTLMQREMEGRLRSIYSNVCELCANFESRKRNMWASFSLYLIATVTIEQDWTIFNTCKRTAHWRCCLQETSHFLWSVFPISCFLTSAKLPDVEMLSHKMRIVITWRRARWRPSSADRSRRCEAPCLSVLQVRFHMAWGAKYCTLASLGIYSSL